jgi:hypothetical protein
VASLAAFWRHTPPAALQLRRIALAIGIKPDISAAPVARSGTAMKQAMERTMAQAEQLGIPIHRGPVDDPLMALLDD